MSDALTLLQNHGQATITYLQEALVRQTDAPPRLLQAMDYSLRAGGKRLRPALVLECFNACGGAAAGSYPSALAAAGAMELIHTFSLVHDDLPAMDDDDLRRGRPTNHKVFGEAMAILAGDAMTTLAFELIAVDAEARLVGPMVAELARQAGPVGMIGGQVLDMDSENQALDLPDLQRIHRMKTGALLMASCRLGALAAGADQNKVQAMGDFGRYLGLAFQIVDDLLDVISTAEQMGKATGKDADRGKNTYPILLGLEPARLQAQQQLATALKILDSFGPPADGLRSLAKFVVERSN